MRSHRLLIPLAFLVGCGSDPIQFDGAKTGNVSGNVQLQMPGGSISAGPIVHGAMVECRGPRTVGHVLCTGTYQTSAVNVRFTSTATPEEIAECAESAICQTTASAAIDSNGDYQLSTLLLGPYTVAVEGPGTLDLNSGCCQNYDGANAPTGACDPSNGTAVISIDSLNLEQSVAAVTAADFSMPTTSAWGAGWTCTQVN